MEQPLLLYIETPPSFGIGLLRGGKLSAFYKEVSFKASSSLLVKTDLLLDTAGIKKEELGGILLCQGPGTFTTMRVLVTTANALSYALGLPLYPFTRFDTMRLAFSGLSHTATLFVIPAYGKEVYYCLAKDGSQIQGCCTFNELSFLSKEASSLVILAGDERHPYSSLSLPIQQVDDTSPILLEQLCQRARETTPVYKTTPLYLKNQQYKQVIVRPETI